jgi:hypothetical protein
MALAAEHAAEEVEGVVLLEPAALLVLLEALVAVLVVDLARLGRREGFVGFGYLDEFGLGCVVAWVLVWVVFLGELSVGGFDLFFRGGFLDS